MKTVHRVPRSVGFLESKASLLNSSIIVSNLVACSWRNEPVPAAHTLFISKSTTDPFLTEMYFESCPPISNMVSTLLSISMVALACAVISLITMSAPTKSPTKYRPLPVTPTPATSRRFSMPRTISASPFLTDSIGSPSVIRYLFRRSFLLLSKMTIFVLAAPTSIPRYTTSFFSRCAM